MVFNVGRGGKIQSSSWLLANYLNGPKKKKTNKNLINGWQKKNREWWERNAMRYDWSDKVGYPEFSKEFFMEIDKRFFSKVFEFLPWTEKPFDSLIDFNSLKNKAVLEVGIGTGSVAQLFAESSADFFGIDITEYAVRATKKRFEIFDLRGKVLQMDAEKLEFPDNYFDFIWSWGVIHHSSDTAKALSEIGRVLKPGGRAVTMVYHRGWWNYYLVGILFYGLLRGDFFEYGSLPKVIRAHTDGALARYYSSKEWVKLASNFGLNVKKIFMCGQKSDIFPIPGGKIKSLLMSFVPDRLTRFFTNTLKGGSFLVSVFEKQ